MKKQKKSVFTKKNMVSVLIVFLMVGSMMGVMWSGAGNSRKEEYENFNFFLKGNRWIVEVEGEQHTFSYFPTELGDIEIEELSDKAQISATYDLDDKNSEIISSVIFDIESELEKQNIHLRRGLTEESEYDLPVIGCSSEDPVIYLKTANNTFAEKEGNCIVLGARDASGFARLRDRLLYSILGVMS